MRKGESNPNKGKKLEPKLPSKSVSFMCPKHLKVVHLKDVKWNFMREGLKPNGKILGASALYKCPKCSVNLILTRKTVNGGISWETLTVE